MSESVRACGRPNCDDCPRQRVGRCGATMQEKEEQRCKCGKAGRSCKPGCEPVNR